MEYSIKQALVLLIALASAATVVMAQNMDMAQQDMVDAHNAARAEVGVGPVTWNDTVAAAADAHMQEYRTDCLSVPIPEDWPYGENTFRSTETNLTGIDAVKSWVEEKQYYDYDTITCSAPAGETCLDYTQVVWSNSTAIGCAGVLCDNNAGMVIICTYSPRGNQEGTFPY